MNVVALFTCFNRKEKTEKAIRSLVDGNPTINFTFIVVDDDSSDGTPNMLHALKAEGYSIKCIHGAGNLFYSGGMRIAMQYIKQETDIEYDYVLLMNDDVEFYSKSIERMVQQSMEQKNSVVVGVTCDRNGNYSYGAIKYIKGIKYVGYGVEFKDVPCDTFNANCVVIPKKHFMACPIIDEHYVHSLGDFDYGFSLKNAGAKIHPTDYYVGICEPNSVKGTWGDRELSRFERIKKKEQPKGLPTNIWFYYVKKNFDLLNAIRAAVGPYVRIFLKK